MHLYNFEKSIKKSLWIMIAIIIGVCENERRTNFNIWLILDFKTAISDLTSFLKYSERVINILIVLLFWRLELYNYTVHP